MKRTFAIATVMMMLGGGLPAHAAPPTVTPSPGYDARLQEQRSASTVQQPSVPAPARRHRGRRIHHGMN
jgi:hypothetical protein